MKYSFYSVILKYSLDLEMNGGKKTATHRHSLAKHRRAYEVMKF